MVRHGCLGTDRFLIAVQNSHGFENISNGEQHKVRDGNFGEVVSHCPYRINDSKDCFDTGVRFSAAAGGSRARRNTSGDEFDGLDDVDDFDGLDELDDFDDVVLADFDIAHFVGGAASVTRTGFPPRWCISGVGVAWCAL